MVGTGKITCPFVEVVGHTSSTGDGKHNLQPSEARANAIKEALSTTYALPAERLFAVGAGQEYPIDGTNPTDAVNRRVQLFNLGVLKYRPSAGGLRRWTFKGAVETTAN